MNKIHALAVAAILAVSAGLWARCRDTNGRTAVGEPERLLSRGLRPDTQARPRRGVAAAGAARQAPGSAGGARFPRQRRGRGTARRLPQARPDHRREAPLELGSGVRGGRRARDR